MKRLFLLPCARAAAIAIALGLTSCASSKKEFFLIQSPSAAHSIQSYPTGPGIGIGPINVASYLDRPHLVFESEPNQLYVSENQRWAGQLDDNIGRVLSQEVAHRLRNSSVRTYPWSSDKGLAQQVSVQILSFHGNAEGDVYLEAEYTIYSLPSQNVKLVKRWTGQEAMEKDGYTSMVAAQGRLLSRFAADLAQHLK